MSPTTDIFFIFRYSKFPFISLLTLHKALTVN